MFGIFRRKRKPLVQIPLDPPQGQYQAVWEKKRQPSPGAQAFAFETLGLSEFTPIGAGVHVRQGIKVLPGVLQPVVGKAVTLQGIPTTAGQIYGQALYDPNIGKYVKDLFPLVEGSNPGEIETPFAGVAI